MIIETGSLTRHSLTGKIAVVTGAGGGIGYEAARSLLWLGSAAQVHLGTTLNEELENTEVAAFTIGPGFVPTQTAASSIPELAAMMGKSEKEMLTVLKAHTLSAEAAGAGFAAAVEWPWPRATADRRSHPCRRWPTPESAFLRRGRRPGIAR